MLSDREMDAIEKAANPTRVIVVGGQEYATDEVVDVRKPEPIQELLQAATLAGLAEYVGSHSLGESDEIVVHIESFQRVSLITKPVGRFKQRDKVCSAVALWPEGLRFGQYIDVETFIVQLMALFVDTPDRANVLQVVGHLADEAVQDVDDDGVTQIVVTKQGVVRKGTASVPNPVVLAPFRTFRDIPQPASPFVLRIKSGGEGKPPLCALFEADGGIWKLNAVESIKGWLSENLASIDVIG